MKITHFVVGTLFFVVAINFTSVLVQKKSIVKDSQEVEMASSQSNRKRDSLLVVGTKITNELNALSLKLKRHSIRVNQRGVFSAKGLFGLHERARRLEIKLDQLENALRYSNGEMIEGIELGLLEFDLLITKAAAIRSRIEDPSLDLEVKLSAFEECAEFPNFLKSDELALVGIRMFYFGGLGKRKLRAMEAIARFENDVVRDFLLDNLHNNSESEIRECSVRELRRYANSDIVRRSLKASLNDPSSQVRNWAEIVLERTR